MVSTACPELAEGNHARLASEHPVSRTGQAFEQPDEKYVFQNLILGYSLDRGRQFCLTHRFNKGS